MHEIEISASRLAFLALFDWAFWIAGAPLVWWLSKRMPPTTLRAFSLVHLPLSLASAVGAIALSQTIRAALEPVSRGFWPVVQARIGAELGWYVVLYWLVVCSYLALDYYAAYQVKITEAYELKLSNAELDRDLIEARLTNLRQQLHPHFLFNALHSVSALMEFSVDDARDKLVRLSALLRMSLAISQHNAHSAVNEMAWLEHYLALEEMRHAPAIRWRLSLDPAADAARVPCLITQPLVENAIKHGSRQADRQGLVVHVSMARIEDGLEICVEDNGPGWPSGEIGEGIGLKYVRRIMGLESDNGAGVTCDRSHLGGARVRLRLALVAVEETADAA